MFVVHDSIHRHCIQLFVAEDERVTPSLGLTLSLELSFDIGGMILLEPADIFFTAADNDGKLCDYTSHDIVFSVSILCM